MKNNKKPFLDVYSSLLGAERRKSRSLRLFGESLVQNNGEGW